MHTYITLGVSEPTERPACRIGGGERAVPLIEFSNATTSAQIALHFGPPTAQVAWLRELSEAASDLADEINLRDLERAS